MKAQQLYSYTRRAVDDFKMIKNGDRIAVGISGGKDSLALLYALCGLQRFYPEKFELEAITVDLGFGIQDFDLIKKFCTDFNVPYTIEKTDIALTGKVREILQVEFLRVQRTLCGTGKLLPLPCSNVHGDNFR